MKAETVLKIPMFGNIETAKKNLDEWITAYRKIAEEHPSAEDMANRFICRVNSAYAILEKREELKSSSLFCKDTVFMESVIESEEKAEAELDGDFPLGNEFDAEFAVPYFQITDLAKIQFGFASEVKAGYYSEFAYDVLIKQGFLYELEGRWKEAEKCYNGVSTSSSVLEREYYCRRKAEEEGEKLYKQGMTLIEQLNWGEAWYPLYKAAELEYTDAVAEIGYMTAYGLGCGRNTEEGLNYLRRAAQKGSDYACNILWEMHGDGFRDVKASEANKWCEEAADRGNIKAKMRLDEGFDLRPVTEILQEQIEKGNIDALWYMAMELDSLGANDLALEYIERAAEAGQTDALLFYAELYGNLSDNDFYDEEKAAAYYRKAAEKGNIKAILALGDRSLKNTDIPFWKRTADDLSEDLFERHKAQFAWYLLAAEGGCVEVMPHIATAYHYGYPCEKNDETAFLWAARAADAGDCYAMYQVGYFYENAIGCEKDMTTALMFYTNAAESGISNAMYRLIDIYAYGKDGIAADKEKENRYRFLSGMGRD